LPSVGDSVRMAVVAAVQADGSARATLSVSPTALPEIWMKGEEARDRFRSLVPGLLRFDPESAVVGLCSTLPGEGTSTVTAGLACALAEARLKVAVIDAQYARPGQTADLWGGLPSGLAAPAITSGESPLGAIDIIGCSRVADGAAPGRLRRLITEARLGARVVLVDLEPLKESSQVLGLAGCLHAIYLVVEAERERREVIARAVQGLTRAGLQVAGMLLNKRPRPIPDFLYHRL